MLGIIGARKFSSIGSEGTLAVGILLLSLVTAGCGAKNVNAAASQSAVQTSAEQLAVSNVTAGSDSQSATVTWSTNLPATSQVEYGTTTAYGSATPVQPDMVTSHSTLITGLAPATEYHYRVHSKTASNDEAVSGDAIVTTGSDSNSNSNAFAPLCSTPPTGRMLNGNPSNYNRLLPTLQPGDTLSLAAGKYSLLVIKHLNGTPTNCITITGPASGPGAVIQGASGNNTVEISSSSYLAIKNLTIDSRGIDGAFGISAHGDSTTPTHHILIQGNTLVGQNSGQQTDGISTKIPTWGWVIRQNVINGAGTGIYLGKSDGTDPFVAGVIEDNLIENPIGYCMEIKYQLPRPNVPGMPTTPSMTIIRNNVFIKNDQPSPDGDRPNLLVGGFPDSGAGSMDMYEIYGNFFYHNPREALFQGSGRISFHDNVLVDGEYTAAVFRNHDLPLKLAYVYNNTVYSTQAGITFGSPAPQGEAVVGNLVFAAKPLSGSMSQQDNIVDTFASAALYVTAPSLTLGKMNFYPLAGKVQGSALPLMQFASDPDYNLDFNRTAKGTMTYRGAYAGSGVNPGWQLQAGIKTVH